MGAWTNWPLTTTALVFLGVPAAVLERGTDRLRCDLAWGARDVKHGHLRSMDTYDAGYRLANAEAPQPTPRSIVSSGP